MEEKKYIVLEKLEIYKLSRELSRLGWKIYELLTWQEKKIFGDQFITSTDSVGANITEGYNRFHFLDKIKFYYNARGSLAEATSYWLELLLERNKVSQELYDEYKKVSVSLAVKLNNYIASIYRSRDNNSKIKNNESQ